MPYNDLCVVTCSPSGFTAILTRFSLNVKSIEDYRS